MLQHPTHQLRIAADRRDEDRRAAERHGHPAATEPVVGGSTRALLGWLSVQPIVRRMRRVGHAI